MSEYTDKMEAQCKALTVAKLHEGICFLQGKGVKFTWTPFILVSARALSWSGTAARTAAWSAGAAAGLAGSVMLTRAWSTNSQTSLNG